MKQIVNKLIPFKGFIAINLFGVLFIREELKDKVSERTINHEAIHSCQMAELLYLPFYLIYLFEYVFRFLTCFNAKKAYRNISFEREAFKNERNMDYLSSRKHFAEWRKN